MPEPTVSELNTKQGYNMSWLFAFGHLRLAVDILVVTHEDSGNLLIFCPQ